ncbi:MAG: Holliday junction resolvase RuvX [Planctomycetota bacterium]
MRYVGIDLGDKRTGLALGDTVTGIASPATLVEVSIEDQKGEALLDALARTIEDLVGTAPATLVVGLPINIDGTEGPRAKLTRAFADRIAARTNRPIEMHDERRTSMAANERLARTGLTHKQKKLRRDAIAAAAILQSYLNTHQSPRQITGQPPEQDQFHESEPDRPANDW